MSITYCHNCNKNIDTDFDATHIEDCVATDPLEHLKMNSIREDIEKIVGKNIKPCDHDIRFYLDKNVFGELETYINKVREEAEQKGYFAGLQVFQMKNWIVKSSDKTEPLQSIKEQSDE